ncbi:methyltransferase domain-containing protein [Candidatus Dojkabacteria bacterium]|nr:methyltransferase domain-containing protein [Candidatus Dojkabacteria bacterium]
MTNNRYFSRIHKYIVGKEILDVGSLGNSWSTQLDDPNRPFHFLCENGKSCIGMDIDKDSVQKYRHKGFKLVHGNAQNFRLRKKFDIIHASDLIEHLENPGNFLYCSYRHLKSGGFLILTTPNAICIGSILRPIFVMLGKQNINAQHTIWFCPTTIKTLLQRSKFKIVLISTYYSDGYSAVYDFLSPELLKSQIIVIAQKKSEMVNQ